MRMVIVRFPDAATEDAAFDFLIGRFSFKTWDTGETMLPAEALAALAAQRIRFSVEGPATYERFLPVRDPVAAAVQ